MRIFIVSFPLLGGSGLLASNLAVQLAENGHEVYVISYDVPLLFKRGYPGKVKIITVPLKNYPLFIDVGPPYAMLLANRLRELTEKLSPDLIHFHYGVHHVEAGFLLKRLVKVPVILTLHGSDVHTIGADKDLNKVMSTMLHDFDEITAVSKFLANKSVEVFNLENMPKVIYNFVDTDLFRPLEKERKNRNENEVIITHASNFREVKNPVFLTEVFAEAVKEIPDMKLQLVGEGPLKRKVYTIAKKRGILDKISFMGIRKDLYRIFGLTDFVAVPSKKESFGLVVAEAMSTSTAVWASNIGGIPEVCRHEKEGFLFELNNFNEALDYMLILAEDKKKRRKLGKNGRKRVLTHFSPEVIIPRYEMLYEEVL